MARSNVTIELRLPEALIQLVHLEHGGATSDLFCPQDVYWVDLCLTPRRPEARARYVERWGAHRYGSMGSLIALPPGESLHLRSEGGSHTCLTCQLSADAVRRWLPDDFKWTDRRLEACLDLANATLHGLLGRLSRELQLPSVGSTELAEAIVKQISIELARHLIEVNEHAEKGGLADWRLRMIVKRLTEAGPPPTLRELARLCNLSVRQLTRGFRVSRSCSIGEYMLQSRIDIAKRRLATEESIKAIATSMGFASQSNFTCSFRRMTGTTPARFRARVSRGADRQAPARQPAAG